MIVKLKLMTDGGSESEDGLRRMREESEKGG